MILYILENALINPVEDCIECGLEWAEAEYHNEYGSIKVSWKRNEDSAILKIDNCGFEGSVYCRNICEPLLDGMKEYILNK